MTGLVNFTYDYLREFVCDSSPASADDLNPQIQQFLILGVGGNSVLLSINEDIAAKVALRPACEHMRHEQSIFELLDRIPCPYIAHSILRRPDITFMQLFANGTLHERMLMDNYPRPTIQWMQQISEAVACLESLGYAHGDINPRNILFDKQDQLRLVDFDHALKAGDNVEVGYEPYVRFDNTLGTYGIAGPITEQFALGSIFWYMTQGKELYSELEGPEKLNKIMKGEFPVVDLQDPVDEVIGNCWQGKFVSIAGLSEQVRRVVMFDKTFQERKRLCEQQYNLLLEKSGGLTN